MYLEVIRGVKDFINNLIIYGFYEEKVYLRKKVGYRIREFCEEFLGIDFIQIYFVRLMEFNVIVDIICDMFGIISIEEQLVGIIVGDIKENFFFF